MSFSCGYSWECLVLEPGLGYILPEFIFQCDIIRDTSDCCVAEVIFYINKYCKKKEKKP